MYLQCTLRWKHYPIKNVHVITMHCTLKALSNKNCTCIYIALYAESTIQLSNKNRTCIYNALYVESTIQWKPYMNLQWTVRWKHYPIKTVHVFTMHCTLKAISNKNRTWIYITLYPNYPHVNVHVFFYTIQVISPLPLYTH